MTDEEGAKKANHILKKFIINSVKHKKTPLFQSFLGRFEINDVEVEIMGDFKYFKNNNWNSLSHFLLHHKLVKIDGFDVPVPYLVDQLKSYQEMGREKDLEKIKKIHDKLT